ncbi:MAG: AMP-binding protein [Gammaproteobacteria bacterium]|nr:AMP-binding protein [Gammaproteobacteria bacterium]
MNNNKTKFDTPITAFLNHKKANPEKIFLRQPIKGEVIQYSYADAALEVQCMAARLSKLPPKSHVAIISLNCAHWVLADLSIMLAGHISVPIYPTASATTITQILEHSNCRLMFIGKMPDWRSSNYLLPDRLETVSMHTEHSAMESWSGIISRYKPLDNYSLPDYDDLASIVYTSGTTGLPKGVMLSFKAIAEAGYIINNWIQLDHHDCFFSYLPLAHAAERVAVEIAAIYCGGMISFLDSLETFNEDLKAARVSIFLGVPRIWIKFQQAIESKIPAILLKTVLKIPLINTLFKKKLLEQLGFSNIKIALSGAAALPEETLKWFSQLDLPICEAYGMTESFGIATFNHPEKRRSGSVGQPLPGCDLKIAENGEVLYKNNCLMEGYYQEPELSNQTIMNNFLHTGDTGKIDSDGYLWITGRIKELFKTSKGKYISPVKIEMVLEPRANLEQICVLGSNMTQPVILASVLEKPDENKLEDFNAHLERILREVNNQLDTVERPAKWFLIDEPWNTKNNLITPTLKLRRQAIEACYLPQINKLLNDKRTIIWLKKNRQK